MLNFGRVESQNARIGGFRGFGAENKVQKRVFRAWFSFTKKKEKTFSQFLRKISAFEKRCHSNCRYIEEICTLTRKWTFTKGRNGCLTANGSLNGTQPYAIAYPLFGGSVV